MSLKAEHLFFRYKKNQDWLIEDYSLQIQRGEVMGLVAYSGYGKSTIGKILSCHLQPEKGSVTVDGQPFSKKGFCPVQLIYQHPELAVNPLWKMEKIMKEAGEVDEELREELGISEHFFDRYPIELSGGELQRFCILRALRPETKYLIADEISTMLDVITQAQIWHVILKYAKKYNIGILVITHDRELAAVVCDRIETC